MVYGTIIMENHCMKKRFLNCLAIVGLALISTNLSAQQKFALVIGNGAYTGTGMSRLANPVNDANDVSGVLSELGFIVDKVLDGSLEQMEDAVIRLKSRLSFSNDSYGFLFYAGHGVQSAGENYLIPVDANIPSENFLRNRSVSVQSVLDELNDARNSLNVVVLDACRDNPFGWARSGSRGLAMMNRQPARSIIVYATSAGSIAADGNGRNGLFTSQLLNNLSKADMEVNEVFRLTGSDVTQVSDNRQIPAIYSQFFGTAYLGGEPSSLPPRPVKPVPPPQPAAPQPRTQSSGRAGADREAKLWTLGAAIGTTFNAPLFIGTLHGTIAPFRHSFLELGVDLGGASGIGHSDYFAVYPFAHYAFFMPFATLTGRQTKGGCYAGAGGGLWSVSYSIKDRRYQENSFLAAITAGVDLLDMIDISYTLRTNFMGISSKVSVGYSYRFL